MTRDSELQALGVRRLLREQPGLRLAPHAGEGFLVTGTLDLNASYADRTIADRFQIEIEVETHVVAHPPRVREVGGRIPADFHQFDGGVLCVGSPLRIRDVLLGPEPVWRYVEHLLIPYLYSWAHLQQFGTLPFGELGHGVRGLLDDYRSLLRLPSDEACRAAFKLLGLRKRIANKQPCPCGSGRRLGRCHNRLFNWWRVRHGRNWFAGQVKDVVPPAPVRKPRWKVPATLAPGLGLRRLLTGGAVGGAASGQQGLRGVATPAADGPAALHPVVGLG